jgi:hypothetical protein
MKRPFYVDCGFPSGLPVFEIIKQKRPNAVIVTAYVYVLELAIWYDGRVKGEIWWGCEIAWFPHVSLIVCSPTTNNRIS